MSITAFVVSATSLFAVGVLAQAAVNSNAHDLNVECIGIEFRDGSMVAIPAEEANGILGGVQTFAISWRGQTPTSVKSGVPANPEEYWTLDQLQRDSRVRIVRQIGPSSHAKPEGISDSSSDSNASRPTSEHFSDSKSHLLRIQSIERRLRRLELILKGEASNGEHGVDPLEEPQHRGSDRLSLERLTVELSNGQCIVVLAKDLATLWIGRDATSITIGWTTKKTQEGVSFFEITNREYSALADVEADPRLELISCGRNIEPSNNKSSIDDGNQSGLPQIQISESLDHTEAQLDKVEQAVVDTLERFKQGSQ